MKNKKSGVLVVIVGIDGAGKTTFLKKVEPLIINLNKSCVVLERKFFVKYAEHFGISEYIVDYMEKLGELLWGAKENDPVTELSDEVWLYMHAIWYDVFQRYILEPAISMYDYILLDSWYYKIMARFLVNVKYDKNFFDILFNNLCKGDIGIMLDTDIEMCKHRKKVISHGEMGEHHSSITQVEPQKRFIAYQNKVREQLIQISINNSWFVCESSNDLQDSDYIKMAQWILQQ